jgi:hypothetical protein
MMTLPRFGRAWRAQAKEWLALLGSLKGLRGLPGAQALRRVVAQQLLDGDPSLQQAALLCLKARCQCCMAYVFSMCSSARPAASVLGC